MKLLYASSDVAFMDFRTGTNSSAFVPKSSYFLATSSKDFCSASSALFWIGSMIFFIIEVKSFVTAFSVTFFVTVFFAGASFFAFASSCNAFNASFFSSSVMFEISNAISFSFSFFSLLIVSGSQDFSMTSCIFAISKSSATTVSSLSVAARSNLIQDLDASSENALN